MYMYLYVCMDVHIYIYIHSKLYGYSAMQCQPGLGMKTREGIGDGWHERYERPYLVERYCGIL